VVAQMPGTIVDIDVNVGDKVTKGQKLLVLEAMKMENEIVAPHDGTVSDNSRGRRGSRQCWGRFGRPELKG